MVKAELGLVERIFPRVANHAEINRRTPSSQLVFEARNRAAAAFDGTLERVMNWPVIRDIELRTDLLDAVAGSGSRRPTIESTMPPKVELPTMFAMQPGPGATGIANSGAPIGSGPVPVAPEPGKGSKLSRFCQRPAVKLTLKVAGGGLIVFGLPFAPVTAGGLFYFTLPLFAAGCGLIRLGMSKAAKAAAEPKTPSPAVNSRKKFPFLMVENMIPAKMRALLYTGYGLGIFLSGRFSGLPKLGSKLAAPLGIVLLGGIHFLLRREAIKKLNAQEDALEASEKQNQAAAAEAKRLAAEAAVRAEEKKPIDQKLLEAATNKNWFGFIELANGLLEGHIPLPPAEQLATIPVALDYAQKKLDATYGTTNPPQPGSVAGNAQALILPLLTKIEPLLPKD